MRPNANHSALALTLACWAASGAACALPEELLYDPAEVPADRSFLNGRVLALLAEYPTDGTHGYYWPRDRSSHGTSRDLYVGGERVAMASPAGTHCCGMVFEVYVRSCEQLAAGPLATLSPADVRELRARFFGSSAELTDRERLVQLGLESMHLGRPVTELEHARPGDLVQFWRHTSFVSSGHQAVFLGWERARDGRIVAIRYWSSQASTDGLGVQTETLEEGNGSVDRARIFLVRPLTERRPAMEPRDDGVSWLEL